MTDLLVTMIGVFMLIVALFIILAMVGLLVAVLIWILHS